MFYEIDPKRREMAFDLPADGFLAGGRVWVDLRGDFSPRRAAAQAVDNFKNTTFEIGSNATSARRPDDSHRAKPRSSR